MKRRISLFLGLGLLLPLAAAPVLSLPVDMVAQPTEVATAPHSEPVYTDPSRVPAEVDKVPIALLVDISSGQTLYSKQADRRFVPASITKTMTMYTAFELLRQGKLDPNKRMRMSLEAAKKWQYVGTSMELDPTMDPRVEDLLLAIANISANDACVVLAEGFAGSVPAWTDLMNGNARKLGMKDSHFGTPNGWMDEGQTFVSAQDLATLAEAMIAGHPDYFKHYIGHKGLTWNGKTKRNHDPLIGKLEGADGIKTGFTNQAGYGFLGTAQRGPRRLVMVLAGATTHQDRDKAARALMDWGFSAWNSRPLYAPGSTVGEARVQGGSDMTVPLVTPAGFGAGVPADNKQPVSLKVVYQGPLQAPVQAGTVVGALEIRIGDAPAHRVPLATAKAVGPANGWQRLRNGLAGLVL